jgi:hypothetical protein
MQSNIGTTIINETTIVDIVLGLETAAPKLLMAESVEWSSAEKANATNSDQIIESVCFIFYPFNGGTKPP